MIQATGEAKCGSQLNNYKIPVLWQMYGHIHVEAATLEDAISYVLGPECPLPEGNYVDDSIQVDVEVMNYDMERTV